MKLMKLISNESETDLKRRKTSKVHSDDMECRAGQVTP